MLSQSRKDHCKKAWSRVKKQYCSGWIVSERGLQAALYSELKKELSTSSHIVVEPTWKTDNKPKKTPDLVIVEKGKITDVFELKFRPESKAKMEDRKKLNSYVEDSNAKYPVSLEPETGQWRDCLRVTGNCHLHFVVVSRHDAAAVWPLPANLCPEINHWYGRTGERDGTWDIQFACDQ